MLLPSLHPVPMKSVEPCSAKRKRNPNRNAKNCCCAYNKHPYRWLHCVCVKSTHVWKSVLSQELRGKSQAQPFFGRVHVWSSVASNSPTKRKNSLSCSWTVCSAHKNPQNYFAELVRKSKHWTYINHSLSDTYLIFKETGCSLTTQFKPQNQNKEKSDADARVIRIHLRNYVYTQHMPYTYVAIRRRNSRSAHEKPKIQKHATHYKQNRDERRPLIFFHKASGKFMGSRRWKTGGLGLKKFCPCNSRQASVTCWQFNQKLGKKSGREKIQIIFRAGKSHTESARKFPHHPPVSWGVRGHRHWWLLNMSFVWFSVFTKSQKLKQPKTTKHDLCTCVPSRWPQQQKLGCATIWFWCVVWSLWVLLPA